MPLVRIALRRGKTAAYRRALGDGVHQAMVETMQVPAADRFQLLSEYDPENFIYDANYLDISRSDDLVIIQITLSAGRKPPQKRALYQQIAANLGRSPGLRPEDILINLVEVAWENWSFGNGEAQYTLG